MDLALVPLYVPLYVKQVGLSWQMTYYNVHNDVVSPHCVSTCVA